MHSTMHLTGNKDTRISINAKAGTYTLFQPKDGSGYIMVSFSESLSDLSTFETVSHGVDVFMSREQALTLYEKLGHAIQDDVRRETGAEGSVEE